MHKGMFQLHIPSFHTLESQILIMLTYKQPNRDGNFNDKDFAPSQLFLYKSMLDPSPNL